MQQAPNVTFVGAQSPAPKVSQYPAPYAPGQETGDWTAIITSLMPLIIIMMMFGMLKPMFQSVSSR